METRFTDETGITIAQMAVYSHSGKQNVIRWGHFDTNGGGMRHVGPWYKSKAEILADHENYLVQGGWMKAEAPTASENATLIREALEESRVELADGLETEHELEAEHSKVARQLIVKIDKALAALTEIEKKLGAL